MTSFYKTICIIDEIKLSYCLNDMLHTMGIEHTIEPDDIQLARNEYESEFLTDTVVIRMVNADSYTGPFNDILKSISDNKAFDIFNSVSLEVRDELVYIMLTHPQMDFEFETYPAFE